MSESDAGNDERTRRPIPDAGIGRFPERLREVMGQESVRAFARKTGLSEAVLRTYMRGETFPTLDRLALIAAAARRAPGWFIGVGEAAPQSQSVRPDANTLQAAIEASDAGLDLAGVDLEPADRATLYVKVYELMADPIPVPQATAQILRLIKGGR